MSENNGQTQSKLLTSLGLCARARAMILGTPMVCEALRVPGKLLLVLESSDTSPSTHKRLTDKCSFYGVRHVRLDVTGIALAAALGKHASLAAVGLTDVQLCRLIEKHLPPATPGEPNNQV